MKNIVYIDGQNFLYRAAKILIEHNLISSKQDLAAINIRALLAPYFPDEELVIRYYGVSKIIRHKELDEDTLLKSRIFANNLRRFKNCLQKQDITFVAAGLLAPRVSQPCKTCGKTEYYYLEKGIDVSLAIDIARDALLDKADHLILLSSDIDLIPALNVARGCEKEITYIGFQNSLVYAISARASRTISLTPLEIIKAFLEAHQSH